MAAKKSIKSSKTAHVLNVIAPNRDAAPTEEESAALSAAEPPEAGTAPAPAAPVQVQVQVAPQPPARPLLPPILEDARANEDALGSKIYDALSLELAGELEDEPAPIEHIPGPVPKQVPEQVPEQVSVQVPETAPESDPEPEPEPEWEPEQEQVQVPEPEIVPNAEPEQIPAAVSPPAPPPVPELPKTVATVSEATETLPDDLVYVNIMQALVEEKAQKYIDMFGLCSCSRCVADVKALALSNLPPKYAVMPKGNMIPMLTVYERRYSTNLTAQIIAACKLVMQSPRHVPDP